MFDVKQAFPAPLRSNLNDLRARAARLLNARGFFVPYAYADQVSDSVSSYKAVLEKFRALDAEVAAFIAEIAGHLDMFRAFGAQPHDPRWSHTMFPPLDGAAAYTVVRKVRPRRILEIGSGSSTHFLARAMQDGGIDGTITCIDPEPRRSINALDVQFIRRLLREEDAEICADFAADDIIFIDSSHIMMPGMDVDIQLNRIFPVLRPGVIVHLHDIFLPYGYPDHWRQRFYSEQNALIGWILSGYFEVMFPGHYALRAHGAAIEERLGRPFPPLATPRSGSIWLRRAA